jgi:hypothetical protein
MFTKNFPQLRLFVAVLVAFGLLAAACGDSDSTAGTTEGADGTDGAPGTTEEVDVAVLDTTSPDDTTAAGPDTSGDDGVRTVPEEYDTIQAAVDASVSGDLVLISPGTYNEAVDVATDNLTIRGLERDTVILDGETDDVDDEGNPVWLENGIRVIAANGVTVENLTAMNYERNGVFWSEVDGYRGSYLNTIRLGDYGIYAFDSVNGHLNDIYAAGAKDAGVYIGQCNPCNAVITDIVSEWNGLGYSGTDAGGNLKIVNSTFRYNRAGIVSDSGVYEFCFPQRGNTIVGNLVYGNNNEETAAINQAVRATGNGILMAGGHENVIMRNRVFDHLITGIAPILIDENGAIYEMPEYSENLPTCDETKAFPLLENPVDALYNPHENEVRENVVSGSGLADIGLGLVPTDAGARGNCFLGNTFETSAPRDLEAIAPCDAEEDTEAEWVDWLNVIELASGDWEESADFHVVELPDPGPQENMPDPATAPAAPATDVPYDVDIDAIGVPDAPE